MNVKRLILPTRCLLGVLLTAFAACAAQAQGTSLKIAVVNFPKVLEEAPEFQDMQKRLQDEFAPRQRDIVAMQQDVQKKTETFQRDASVMGEDERLNLEREIRDLRRDLQRAQNEFQEDANIRQNEEVSKVNRILLQRVQGFARAAGYDLILAEAVFASPAADITADVIEALKKQPESGGR